MIALLGTRRESNARQGGSARHPAARAPALTPLPDKTFLEQTALRMGRGDMQGKRPAQRGTHNHVGKKQYRREKEKRTVTLFITPFCFFSDLHTQRAAPTHSPETGVPRSPDAASQGPHANAFLKK